MSERVRIEHYEAEDVHRRVREYAGKDIREDIHTLLEEFASDVRSDDASIYSTVSSILDLIPLQSHMNRVRVEDLVNDIGEVYERALARAHSHVNDKLAVAEVVDDARA
jgi:hypothetical protein